jgi:hypothetical protein
MQELLESVQRWAGAMWRAQSAARWRVTWWAMLRVALGDTLGGTVLGNVASGLAGAAVGGAIGGAAGALSGANGALSADLYNRQLHPNEKQKLAQLQRDNRKTNRTDSPMRRAIWQCAAQLSSNDRRMRQRWRRNSVVPAI